MAAAAESTPQFVATIDFGTTYCSVAYLLRPDLAPNLNEVDPTVLTLDNAGNRRVPSCILFDPDGKKMAFGYEARDQYADLEPELRPLHHYFEHVKKVLQHKKDIETITALNGKQFFLVDVIAHILHDLKCRLLTALEDEGEELTSSDIDWVITMPAMKEPKEEKMMREAGYKALCSGAEPPNLCTTTKTCSQPRKETSPEKLSLILEPESAAIHCRRKAEEAGRGSQYVVKGKNYLVVDIGGGTVDIASHRILDDRSIKEIAPPAGNFWGGTTVNEEFSKFLHEFVGDPEFSSYIDIKNSSPGEYAQHKADLNELIYTRFEKHKRRFGSLEACPSYIIKFPHSFWKMYQGLLVKKGGVSKGEKSVRVEDDGARMRIHDSKMAEFFQPAINGIASLIETYLKNYKIAREIDTIYWVGGFGGCKYVRNQLEAVMKQKFKGCKYKFSVPPDPEFAVIRGATAFLCDPSTIARKNSDSRYFDQASSPRPDEKCQQLKQSTSSDQTTSANEELTSQRSEVVDFSPPPHPPLASTDVLAEKDLLDITDYLLNMDKTQIYNLGLVMGLTQPKLKKMMDSDTFLDDVIAAWLRKEDNVKEKGEPSWTVLIRSLKHRRVSQTGIADDIADDIAKKRLTQ